MGCRVVALFVSNYGMLGYHSVLRAPCGPYRCQRRPMQTPPLMQCLPSRHLRGCWTLSAVAINLMSTSLGLSKVSWCRGKSAAAVFRSAATSVTSRRRRRPSAWQCVCHCRWPGPRRPLPPSGCRARRAAGAPCPQSVVCVSPHTAASTHLRLCTFPRWWAPRLAALSNHFAHAMQ